MQPPWPDAIKFVPNGNLYRVCLGIYVMFPAESERVVFDAICNTMYYLSNDQKSPLKYVPMFTSKAAPGCVVCGDDYYYDSVQIRSRFDYCEEDSVMMLTEYSCQWIVFRCIQK